MTEDRRKLANCSRRLACCCLFTISIRSYPPHLSSQSKGIRLASSARRRRGEGSSVLASLLLSCVCTARLHHSVLYRSLLIHPHTTCQTTSQLCLASSSSFLSSYLPTGCGPVCRCVNHCAVVFFTPVVLFLPLSRGHSLLYLSDPLILHSLSLLSLPNRPCPRPTPRSSRSHPSPLTITQRGGVCRQRH